MSDPLVRSAARWVVHDLGVPFNMTTDTPPPPALRWAMYEVIHEDRDGDLHGNTLSLDAVIEWADEEAHWPSRERVRDTGDQT